MPYVGSINQSSSRTPRTLVSAVDLASGVPKRGMTTVQALRARSTVDPYDRNPYDPCWHWTGAKAVDGTPRMWTVDHDRAEKRSISGPKAVWNISRGRGTGQYFAYRTCVACDCVNPSHHALAASKAEIGAHIKRMGSRKGTAVPQRRENAKLAHAARGIVPVSPEVVRAARAWVGTNVAFAELHGISHTTVSRIRRGDSHRGVA
jgi:hypothetical protein